MAEKEKFFENKIENNPKEEEMFKVPEDEIEESFSRSSGKGGQHVNKVSTKVTRKWNVLKTEVLTRDQKDRILEEWEGTDYMDNKGNFIVYSQSERSQAQNRKDAREKMDRLIGGTLVPKKERIPTKPSRAVHERGIEEKKRISKRKEMRRKIRPHEIE